MILRRHFTHFIRNVIVLLRKCISVDTSKNILYALSTLYLNNGVLQYTEDTFLFWSTFLQVQVNLVLHEESLAIQNFGLLLACSVCICAHRHKHTCFSLFYTEQLRVSFLLPQKQGRKTILMLLLSGRCDS